MFRENYGYSNEYQSVDIKVLLYQNIQCINILAQAPDTQYVGYVCIGQKLHTVNFITVNVRRNSKGKKELGARKSGYLERISFSADYRSIKATHPRSQGENYPPNDCIWEKGSRS